ncbi:uncharacterized protein UTRI_04783 [Ustilago trichophora]|uniref:Uncharacterized protein n=1 Tax=Ustilago trichophora TaxID=86804 RepID=A0A5C3EFI4_9BASI|nr:uncharacterized protein UTRI_04783 [Ustilago trichophora]
MFPTPSQCLRSSSQFRHADLIGTDEEALRPSVERGTNNLKTRLRASKAEVHIQKRYLRYDLTTDLHLYGKHKSRWTRTASTTDDDEVPHETLEGLSPGVR